MGVGHNMPSIVELAAEFGVSHMTISRVINERPGVSPALAFQIRKRMREIDRELAHLARRMKKLRVVDPVQQPNKNRVFFGATVTLADEDDTHQTVTIVGDDEQDAGARRIGWSAPLARALRGASVGDLRRVRLPGGEKEWEVIAIAYPDE